MSLQTTSQNQIQSHNSNDLHDLIKKMWPWMSEEEFQQFRYVCERTGLDPFIKQIHPVPRKSKDKATGQWVNKMTIQTGIDGYRLMADRTCKYMPGKSPTYQYDKSGNLLSATAYVKKLGPDSQWHEIDATAYWSEYVQKDTDGTISKFWLQMPHGQLGKCAEALALRKSFPADMSGVYTHEEMSQAHVETIAIDPVVKDVFTTEAIINPLQYGELLNMLDMDSDEDYLVKDLFPYLSRKSGQEVTSLQKVPVSLFETCKKAFSKRKEKRDAEKVSHVLDKPISDEIAF